MVLDKLLHHLKLSKNSRLMESDGDDDSVYSKSAPSTASSQAKLFPTSNTHRRKGKSSFWSSPLKRVISKLVECNRLASWCRRLDSQDSPTSCASAASTDELPAGRKSIDDWLCHDEEPIECRCERQELLIQQQRLQLQQQQLLICQQRQQQLLLCQKQQEWLEAQQQQKQRTAERQRHRSLKSHQRQERSHGERQPPHLRRAQTLQRAQRANNRPKRSRSPLNSAACASPRKLRERLELLQRERRRSERLERSQRLDGTNNSDEGRVSKEALFIQHDAKRSGRVTDQNFISPAQIYAKPGSKITVKMFNDRLLKVRIDVQENHREKRCSTPTLSGISSDKGFRLHENQKPQKQSPYHWIERRHPTEFHDRCPPRSTFPLNQCSTHNASCCHNKRLEHRICARDLRSTAQSNVRAIFSQVHFRHDNPGISLSIREQYSPVFKGMQPDLVIDAPNRHVNCFSPEEHFICHHF